MAHWYLFFDSQQHTRPYMDICLNICFTWKQAALDLCKKLKLGVKLGALNAYLLLAECFLFIRVLSLHKYICFLFLRKKPAQKTFYWKLFTATKEACNLRPKSQIRYNWRNLPKERYSWKLERYSWRNLPILKTQLENSFFQVSFVWRVFQK